MADRANVAIGSLYISHFFSEEDKASAESIVNELIDEYRELMQKSEWMDEQTKSNALATTNSMLKFIGYHENLRHADNYYDGLERWDEFFEMTLSFVIFRTDRDFTRLFNKKPETDWTK